jgi:hypothetical protein
MSATRAAALLTLMVLPATVTACDPTRLGGSADVSADVSAVRLTDPVGDVFLDGPGDHTDAGAKHARNVDLTGAELRRTDSGLRVRLSYDDLAPRASREWNVSFEVVTSDAPGLTYAASWEVGRYADTHQWFRGFSVTELTSEDSLGGPCSGSNAHQHRASATVDYAADTLTLTIPNRCLGGAGSAWMRIDRLTSGTTSRQGYIDNPFNTTSTPGSSPHLVAPTT